jgi:hypothetical protein
MMCITGGTIFFSIVLVIFVFVWGFMEGKVNRWA